MAKGGKGTVVTNGGEQGDNMVRIVQIPEGAPENCSVGQLVKFYFGVGYPPQLGALYDLTYGPNSNGVDGYILGTSPSYGVGTVTGLGDVITVTDDGGYGTLPPTMTIRAVVEGYEPKAGDTPNYPVVMYWGNIGETVYFAAIFNSDGTVFDADFVTDVRGKLGSGL